MERPLSPFMFPVWYRFQITSALSILHRLTGIGLAVGSILLAWWLISVAAGGELFEATHALPRLADRNCCCCFSGRSPSSITSATASGISPGTPATVSRSAPPTRSGYAVLAMTALLTVLAWLYVFFA